MDTARAWKLSVGIATLMLIAVTAALVAARGSLGFADWPAVVDAPVAEETVVLAEPAPPAAPAREPRDREAAAPAAPVDAAPEPVTAVRGAEAEREAPREPRVESEPAPPGDDAEEPPRSGDEPDAPPPAPADRPPAPEQLPLARPADAAIPVAPEHK